MIARLPFLRLLPLFRNKYTIEKRDKRVALIDGNDLPSAP